MGLPEIYLGHQTWQSFITAHWLAHVFEQAINCDSLEDRIAESASISIRLAESDYETAFELGLGALTPAAACQADESTRAIEIGYEKAAAGLAHLNADFNAAIGDSLWKIEMRSESLRDALQQIRLPEFEREARAFRNRAETAYFNGWHEEALADFLQAEKRNYPDFAVLRSIASIYLYRLVNLPEAILYFLKAAKYSRPNNRTQSAECFFFAGLASAFERRTKEAIAHLDEAIKLNPEFFDAHYQRACLAAITGNSELAIQSLESAIKGDARYYERAARDACFDSIRAAVLDLLERLMEPVRRQVAQIKKDAEMLRRYVIAKRDTEQSLSTIFQNVERQLAGAKTYRAGILYMQTLAQIHEEIKSIYDLFYKQYKMDARDYVRSVAFSPDGRLVASGFLYEGIKIWEVETGLYLQSLRGHSSSVNSVAFSPDSQWLASGSRDRTIKIWDAQTGHEIRTLEGHTGEVRAVTFSPDGIWLASASSDRTVRLWRTVTGQEVEPLAGHTLAVTSAAFSPDGAVIASGSLDHTIKLWDVATGREVKTFEGHTGGVASLAFSADGLLLVSGGEDKKVKIWDVREGRELKTLTGHVNDVISVAFSPDGELVAAGSLGQTIRIWKQSTGRVIKTLWFREIAWHPVVFSPRGQWLAFASRDVQLWLKALLTEEEFAEVRAGEERARVMKEEADALARELAELKRIEKEEAAREILRAARRAQHLCEVCGIKLKFARRITRRPRCKAHKGVYPVAEIAPGFE